VLGQNYNLFLNLHNCSYICRMKNGEKKPSTSKPVHIRIDIVREVEANKEETGVPVARFFERAAKNELEKQRNGSKKSI